MLIMNFFWVKCNQAHSSNSYTYICMYLWVIGYHERMYEIGAEGELSSPCGEVTHLLVAKAIDTHGAHT